MELISGRGLDYVYNDNTRIWIGVDANLAADDAYVQAKAQFGQKIMPAAFCILVAVVCAFLFVITGREIQSQKEDGKFGYRHRY